MKSREIELLVVVGMFLTGFDAPRLNTLFGDQNTANVVLEKSYKEYMEGFTYIVTGEARRNILQNYDEFASLKALQGIDTSDPEAVDAFKAQHYVGDDDLAALKAIRLPPQRRIQDYKSTYNDIRDWLRQQNAPARCAPAGQTRP